MNVIRFLAVLGLIGGCSSLTDDSLQYDLMVDVEDPILQYQPSNKSMHGILEVTIRNTGTASVFFSGCGFHLQRSSQNQWLAVWWPVCSAIALPPTEIGPGEDFDLSVQIDAVLGSGLAEPWQPPVEGEYRIVLEIADEDHERLPVSTRASNPFRIAAP